MLQQQAKRQGSPWRSPGAKAPSPRASSRVARPAGFEAQLLEPEDLAWDSPSSIRQSSSAHPSPPGDTSTDHEAAPKEAADPSSEPQSDDGLLLGSQEGSPDKVQRGSGRQGKGLSSYPLEFSGKADALKRLTEKEQRRSRGSTKVCCHSVSLLAAFVGRDRESTASAFPVVAMSSVHPLNKQSTNQAVNHSLKPDVTHWTS